MLKKGGQKQTETERNARGKPTAGRLHPRRLKLKSAALRYAAQLTN